MAIEDYIPNVFGNVPSAYQGLLGTEESAALQRRSNIGGLLSAGAALAQGMSAQGPRRSALQNVLTALASGYTGAGQASQAGIEQMVNAQKFGQMQRQQQAFTQIINDPAVANNPTLKAYLMANPEKAFEYLMNMQQTNAARSVAPEAPVVPAQPQPVVGQESAQENVLPAVQVTGTPPSKFDRQLKEAEAAQAYWSRLGNTDKAKAAREEADSLRGLIRQGQLAGGVRESLTGINPMLQPLADALYANAENMTADQIQASVQSIREKDAQFKVNTEKELRNEYNQLPAVKEFSTVRTAYKQISNALANPSAANDLAAATKFMKLLDPGSVVRESELGLAMAATGAIDRMQNYFQRLQNGQMLNPSQRADFKRAAELAYQAAEETYGQISDQYVDLSKSYGVSPDNVVLKSKRDAGKPNAKPNVPQRNTKGWTLSVDANGNRAYVSPDGMQFEEVK